MKKVIFNIKNNSEEFENQISLGWYHMYDISIEVCLNGRNLLDIIKDKDLFIKIKEAEIEIQEDLGEDSSHVEESFDYILNNFDNLLDCIDLFAIDDEIDIKKFLEENPILKNKKIVTNEHLDISDFEQLQKLIKEYEGINAYVHLIGNIEHISLKDCEMTMNYIKNIGEKVKLLNLSPFETIIYVYDIIRDRYYKYETADERYTKSRDLSEVIFGDAIVCHGYAELFKAVLNYIGIETYLTPLKQKNGTIGHSRNEIRLVDPKYDINGVYYFDTTWDSKKKNREDEFLLSYKYLAKTRDEMEKLENYKYNYEHSPRYGKNMVEEFTNFYKNHDAANFLQYIKTFNYISRATNSGLYLNPAEFLSYSINIDNIKDELQKMIDNFNKPISAETFIRAVNEVRKIEYYIDSEKYPYSLAVLYCIFMNSKWEFERHHYSTKERLIMTIYGDGLGENHTKENDFDNFICCDFDRVKDIEGVQLTKVLKKELEKRKTDRG